MDTLYFSHQDQNEIAYEAAEAAREAVDAALNKLWAKQDKANKANLKASQRRGAEYSERFDIEVVRYRTIYGWDCDIYMRGANFGYKVYQNAHKAGKPGVTPEWHVQYWWSERSTGYHRDTVLWDMSTEDFEAAIKECIMLMIWPKK